MPLPDVAAVADDVAAEVAAGVLLDDPRLAVASLVAAVTVAGPRPLRSLGAWRLVAVVDAAWQDAGGAELDLPGAASRAASEDVAVSLALALVARSRLAAAGSAWLASGARGTAGGGSRCGGSGGRPARHP